MSERCIVTDCVEDATRAEIIPATDHRYFAVSSVRLPLCREHFLVGAYIRNIFDFAHTAKAKEFGHATEH